MGTNRADEFYCLKLKNVNDESKNRKKRKTFQTFKVNITWVNKSFCGVQNF